MANFNKDFAVFEICFSGCFSILESDFLDTILPCHPLFHGGYWVLVNLRTQ